MEYRHMKRYTLAIRKIQIKTIMRQYYTPTEMPKIKKRPIMPNGKTGSTQTSHIMLAGLWNFVTPLKNNMAVSEKVNGTSTMWLSYSTPSYFLKKNGSICPCNYLWRKVYSSIICDSRRLEITQMSTNRLINKQVVVHAHNDMLLSKSQ